jgi:hypothetical protein
MADTERDEPKCSECEITEAEHRELYGTPLGTLTFTLQPDAGPPLSGRLRLCRPCTPTVLSRKLLNKAGIPDEALSPAGWP